MRWLSAGASLLRGGATLGRRTRNYIGTSRPSPRGAACLPGRGSPYPRAQTIEKSAAVRNPGCAPAPNTATLAAAPEPDPSAS